MTDEQMTYEKCFHSEYGGYVYQIKGYREWVEPFVTEKEAQAFLQGVAYAEKESKDWEERATELLTAILDVLYPIVENNVLWTVATTINDVKEQEAENGVDED